VPRLRRRESRATWWGRARPSGPSLSAREPFTRTLDPSCQTRRTAWVRWCCSMPAGPFHRSRRGLPPRGAENAKRPASTSGGGALDPSSARSGCGYLPPQRTTSRDLCLILPIPPTADGRPRNAAESITAVRAAGPAPEGRHDGPTRLSQPVGRPCRRHRRTRLRRGPERARGGGHGRAMRHPEGGGERGGHLSVFRSSAVVRFVLLVRPVAGRGFSANENGRRVRPPRFRGDPVSQTSPGGRGAAPTAWDATPVSCAEHNRAPRPASRGSMLPHPGTI
jgi:hypothetical protein